MTIKEIAKDFIQLVAKGKIDEGFSKYSSEDFIHHNQYFPGDKKSIIDAMKQDHAENPNVNFIVYKCFQDGNQVMTFSKVVKNNMEFAVVHIYRFEDDKIQEMWDVGQILEKESPNENGMF